MKSSLSWTAVCYITLIEGGCSWVLYRLPVQIAAPDIYDQYLVPSNSSVIAFLLFAWFLLGAYKTAMMIAWDPKGRYFRSGGQQVKTLLLVPLAPFIPFKAEWYRLPRESDTSSDNERQE